MVSKIIQIIVKNSINDIEKCCVLNSTNKRKHNKLFYLTFQHIHVGDCAMTVWILSLTNK